MHVKTLFSYFQQFSLPKVRKTRLQTDFVTNNQILVVKIIKIRPHLLFRHPSPRLLDFMNFSDPPPPPSPPRLWRPHVYSGPNFAKFDLKIFSRFWSWKYFLKDWMVKLYFQLSTTFIYLLIDWLIDLSGWLLQRASLCT